MSKCRHFWIKGLSLELALGRGCKHEYECVRCYKRVERWTGHEPISGSSDPLYDRKDPLYNLSPPILYINRGNL